MKELLTQKFLKEVLDYDPETGVFTWIKKLSKSSKVRIGAEAGGTVAAGYLKITLLKWPYPCRDLAFLYQENRAVVKGEKVINLDGDVKNNRWLNLKIVDKSFRPNKRERGELTQAEVKALLNYDPETGVFTWKARTSQFSKVAIGSVAGALTPFGYVRFKVMGTAYTAHRIAWLYQTGELPSKAEVDHINHDRADNRWCNLRLVSVAENNRNKSMQKNNTSGVMGVFWRERNQVWVAHIKVNSIKYNLGQSKDFDEAVKMRKDAEIKYGFHKNHGH